MSAKYELDRKRFFKIDESRDTQRYLKINHASPKIDFICKQIWSKLGYLSTAHNLTCPKR